MKYGPSTNSVVNLISRLEKIDWFRAVGIAVNDDVKFVDFHFMANLNHEMYKAWGNCLATHETPVDKIIMENALLGEEEETKKAIDIMNMWEISSADKLFYELDVKYGDKENGFYKGTYTYPNEFIEVPNRLVRYAALELLISHIDPSHNFFQNLITWFEMGHWPIGWDGVWPNGRLIVW